MCRTCKYCTWVTMAYEDGITNVCDRRFEIEKMSLEQLEDSIKNGCPLYEAGKPKTNLSQVCFDD